MGLSTQKIAGSAQSASLSQAVPHVGVAAPSSAAVPSSTAVPSSIVETVSVPLSSVVDPQAMSVLTRRERIMIEVRAVFIFFFYS